MSALNPSLSGSLSGPRVLADVLPGDRVRDVLLVVGGAALTGIAAQIAFTIPSISPVPFTLQTFAVLLVGASFGWLRGALSMALYLVAGLAGVPWFAHGASGYNGDTKATMGYLVGFVAAAALAGWLSQRGNDRRFMSSVSEMFLPTLVIYAFGVTVLMAVLNVDLVKGIELGVLPFVVTDTIKLLAAAGLLPLAWKLVEKVKHG
ncbi:MAG: biotin transporter BioY [Actinomycetes bacterium]